MALVMAGMFTLALALLALWVWSLWGSLRRDQNEAAARDTHAQERWAQEAHEVRLREPGACLHCLGCNLHFSGPLPDEGCPQCHLSGLVVLEEEAHGNKR